MLHTCSHSVYYWQRIITAVLLIDSNRESTAGIISTPEQIICGLSIQFTKIPIVAFDITSGRQCPKGQSKHVFVITFLCTFFSCKNPFVTVHPENTGKKIVFKMKLTWIRYGLQIPRLRTPHQVKQVGSCVETDRIFEDQKTSYRPFLWQALNVYQSGLNVK